MINNANPNHPSTIAVVPTPLKTLPFPRSCAIIEAATEAVCCHSTETRTKIEAMKMIANAIWETGRDGKGLTSRSLPDASSSSCHPGKVARSSRQIKANTMATMLRACQLKNRTHSKDPYIKYGKTIISLNWLASQIRFNGSWSTLTSFAKAVALLLHNHAPPSGLIQIPKYPTRADSVAWPTMLAMALWTLKSVCAVDGTGV